MNLISEVSYKRLSSFATHSYHPLYPPMRATTTSYVVFSASFGANPTPDKILVAHFVRDVGTVYSAASLQQNTRVVWIEHRKTKRISQHEYISFKVMCRLSDGSNTFRYGRVERHPKHIARPIPYHHFGLPVDAMDCISIASAPFADENTTSYSLYTMKFPNLERSPNLLQLSAILSSVTLLAPEYRLFTSACYWYARMVFEGLAHVFDGRVAPAEKSDFRGKYAGLVPLVLTTGSLLLGDPPAYEAWQRFQLAIERDSMGSEMRLKKLFNYLFSPQLEATSLEIQRAENAVARLQ